MQQAVGLRDRMKLCFGDVLGVIRILDHEKAADLQQERLLQLGKAYAGRRGSAHQLHAAARRLQLHALRLHRTKWQLSLPPFIHASRYMNRLPVGSGQQISSAPPLAIRGTRVRHFVCQ